MRVQRSISQLPASIASKRIRTPHR